MYPPHYLGYHRQRLTIKAANLWETFFLTCTQLPEAPAQHWTYTEGIYIFQGAVRTCRGGSGAIGNRDRL